MSFAEGMNIKSTFFYVGDTSVPLHHPYPSRNGSILLQFVQTKLFSIRLFLPVKLLFSVLNHSLFYIFTSVCTLKNSCMAEVHIQHMVSNKTKKRTSVSYWLLYVKSTVWSSDIKHYRSNIRRSLFCFKYYPNSKCDFQIFVQLFLQFNVNKNINMTKLRKETVLLPL